jgi:hypothetical protein
MRTCSSHGVNRCNGRHKVFGHLFSGRYKALFVEDSGNGYLKSACDDVDLNPVRAGGTPQEQLSALHRPPVHYSTGQVGFPAASSIPAQCR